MNDDIYPVFYFCRGGVSDIKWILKMLTFIPEDKKQPICNEYSRIFLGDPESGEERKKANVYLHSQAKKYRELNSG